MLRKKRYQKKVVKRVQKRRTRKFIYFFLLTIILSSTAVIGSFMVRPRESILSPLPVLSATDKADMVKLVEKELQKADVKVKSVEVDPGIIVVSLEENQEVYLSPERSIQKDLASLQLIMRQLTMEGKRFTRLDLRFDKPVITTN